MARRRELSTPRQEVWGLHPKTCRCPASGERVVALRRRGLIIAGMPLLALEAIWRTCTRCDDTLAIPRLGLGTVSTLTLLLAALAGGGIPGFTFLGVGLALAMLWGLWMVQHALVAAYRRRLVPLNYRLRRSIETTPGRSPQPRAARAAQRARAVRRPIG